MQFHFYVESKEIQHFQEIFADSSSRIGERFFSPLLLGLMQADQNSHNTFPPKAKIRKLQDSGAHMCFIASPWGQVWQPV